MKVWYDAYVDMLVIHFIELTKETETFVHYEEDSEYVGEILRCDDDSPVGMQIENFCAGFLNSIGVRLVSADVQRRPKWRNGMKRDMELIRSMLLHLEEGGTLEYENFKGYSEEKVYWHGHLLVQAGFFSEEHAIHGITWQGYEFLDAARDDEVWAEFLKVPRSHYEIYEVARQVQERRKMKAAYEDIKTRTDDLIERYNKGEYLISADAVGRENPAARVVQSDDLPATWEAGG